MTDRSAPAVRELLRFAPTPGAHRVALRAGLSVAVPLLVLYGLGRLDWSMFAAFGAFTSLYGRNHVHVPRARMQGWVGLVLLACIVAGTATGISAARAWLAVPIAAAVAGGCTYLSERQDWHPPGALFPIFAFTGCASLPRAAEDLPAALLVGGLSVAFAVLVGNAGAFWRGRRERTGRAGAGQGEHDGRGGRGARPGDVDNDREDPAAQPGTDGRRARTDGLVRHLLRAVAAVGIAGTVATGVGIGHPYWAMVSAVVPLVSRELSVQLTRASHRVVGTALGLAASAALLALDLTGLGMIAVIVSLQVGAELLVGRNYAVALTCITPLALMMGQLVVPQPIGDLLLDRALETLIGVAIGVLVGGVTRRGGPLDRRRDRRAAARQHRRIRPEA